MIDLSELSNWNEYIKLLAGLLAMVDPIGAVTVYLSVSEDRPAKEKREIIMVAAAVFIGVMLLFTFLGDAILALFSISIESFQIAGGVVLLLIALDMMVLRPKSTTTETQINSESSPASVAAFPLAIPMLAGPGAISLIIVFSHLHNSFTHKLLVGSLILTTATVIIFVFRAASVVGQLAGKTGMIVFDRIMGMIVASIGVEFIIGGIQAVFFS